ncbi:MAG TPA: sodium:proton antiporter, partial [Planctomycetota bacterium]|nr:sodium:proton antiporter [Planctomycetota bacterium]
RGVEFFWTLRLWKVWLLVNGLLLTITYIWDSIEYKKEAKEDVTLDETQVEPLGIKGGANFLLLGAVVFLVATVDPSRAFLGTSFVPFMYMRELLLLACAGLSFYVFTPKDVHAAVNFNFGGIIEVAALFIGIFLTMQIPIEILVQQGAQLGIDSPAKFFWASGSLSSFLDNTPTYIVFFSSAKSLAVDQLHHDPSVKQFMYTLSDQSVIDVRLLTAIALGSVMMGANTYIGNGPNFLVKSVAEGAGVKMPSFFGYMGYSICILIPIFIVITFIMQYLV